MIRRPPRSTHCISSAASDVYKRQITTCKRKRELANVDRIYEIIKASYTEKQLDYIPSIAEISGKIALLELEGIIVQNKENLTLSQQKVA